MQQSSRDHAKAACSAGASLALSSWLALTDADNNLKLLDQAIDLLEGIYAEFAHLGISIDLEAIRHGFLNHFDNNRLTPLVTKVKFQAASAISSTCGDEVANWFNLAFTLSILCAATPRQIVYEYSNELKQLANTVGFPSSRLEGIIEKIANGMSIIDVVDRFNLDATDIIDTPKIFISHTSADNALADKFANHFRQRGIRVFLDNTNLNPGNEWFEQLRDEIRQSDEIMMILTPDSLHSSWLMIEAGAAWILDKTIVPVTIDLADSILPEPIKRFQSYKLAASHDEENLIDSIVQRLHP